VLENLAIALHHAPKSSAECRVRLRLMRWAIAWRFASDTS
jgi:hypothetical protein